jgi:hypothetical protein
MAEALLILAKVIPEADTQTTLLVVRGAEVENDLGESLLPKGETKPQEGV